MSFASKGYVENKVRAVEDSLKALFTSGAHPLGAWDASTNTPTITQGTGTEDSYYFVSKPGTWDSIDFVPGDMILFTTKTNRWERIASGEIRNTLDIRVTSSTTESISGGKQNQKEINEDLVNNINNIIIFVDDVNNVTSPKKRPYYQTNDTSERDKGLYTFDNGWVPLGGGVGKPDNNTIEISNNKLTLKGFGTALENTMPVKDATTGKLKWERAISIEELDRKVEQAANAATQSGTYAAQSGNYAAQALQYKEEMKETFKVFEDIKEWDEARKQGQLTDNTISFIKEFQVATGTG